MDPLGQSADARVKGSGTSSLWLAAFRCLARADPSMPELQTLGREQVRQVVLNRYKSLGIFAPQCMSSLGGFQRERPGTGGGAAVKNNGKLGNIGEGGRRSVHSVTLSFKIMSRIQRERSQRSYHVDLIGGQLLLAGLLTRLLLQLRSMLDSL